VPLTTKGSAVVHSSEFTGDHDPTTFPCQL
jgi:hypothetical protein